MAQDIACAMAHLHCLSPPVLHRDLKLENCLVSRGPSKQLTVKTADYGLHVVRAHGCRSAGCRPNSKPCVAAHACSQLQQATNAHACRQMGSSRTRNLLGMLPVDSHVAHAPLAHAFSVWSRRGRATAAAPTPWQPAHVHPSPARQSKTQSQPHPPLHQHLQPPSSWPPAAS